MTIKDTSAGTILPEEGDFIRLTDDDGIPVSPSYEVRGLNAPNVIHRSRLCYITPGTKFIYDVETMVRRTAALRLEAQRLHEKLHAITKGQT